jgi:hypothetical protein
VFGNENSNGSDKDKEEDQHPDLEVIDEPKGSGSPTFKAFTPYAINDSLVHDGEGLPVV